jgi:hypothetical protein
LATTSSFRTADRCGPGVSRFTSDASFFMLTLMSAPPRSILLT